MYSVGESIQATYVDANPYGSSEGSLRVYIPSLMPLITMGNPRVTPVSLNKSCYCNSNDCKPAISSKLDTQNYVTARASYNEYKYGCYWFGSGLRVISKTPDCLSCSLSPGEEDNSTLWP